MNSFTKQKQSPGHRKKKKKLIFSKWEGIGEGQIGNMGLKDPYHHI